MIRRVHEAAWNLNWSPWDCSLNIEAPHCRQSWFVTYMTATATWHVLPALAGMTVDLLGGELHYQPRTSYRGPVFFPTFWAWVECAPGKATARIVKVFEAGELKRVNGGERRLPIREGAVWELSDCAQWSTPRPVAARFTPPARQVKPWVIRSVRDLDGDLPALHWNGALDGERATRWTTDRPMRPGDWVEVDLGAVQTVRALRLLHDATREEQQARGMRVEVGQDGVRWTTVAELSAGEVRGRIADGWLVVPFAAPEQVRYVRLTNLGSAELMWWSIHEFDVE